MNLFLSWSKGKSKKLAEITKEFLEKTLGSSVRIFFSPDMYLGTCADRTIHDELLTCEKCLVCITEDNFKSPWLLYEAGMVYGANYSKQTESIVIPILFENIPQWSSWIDKPLNRYVPIQMNDTVGDFASGKESFERFLYQLAREANTEVKNFNKSWNAYKENIKYVLESESAIPSECKDLYRRILEKDNGTFSVNSPEIRNNEIVFHKGYKTHELLRILTDSIMHYQGKYLWLYGRKHELLMSRAFDDFFNYLSREGLRNGVDFKCLFPMPKSSAAVKASSRDRADYFDNELQRSLELALILQERYGLDVGNLFRLYKEPQRISIIRCDNAVLHHFIIRDENGYPLSYFNSGFTIASALSPDATGNSETESPLIQEFRSVWDNAEPLSKALMNSLYGNKF